MQGRCCWWQRARQGEILLHDGLVAGGDDEVERDGLGELDAGGGAGGDLVLVGAGWGEAEVGVGAASATA